MKIKIEIDLDDEQLTVIKDIASATGPVRRFSGVWWDRVDFLVLMNLVEMTAFGSLWDIKLTEPGHQVHRLLIKA